VVVDLLVFAAYPLTVMWAYSRIRRDHPSWELRAELAAMIIGLCLLLALAWLAADTPSYSSYRLVA
jgi:hypothetical protein